MRPPPRSVRLVCVGLALAVVGLLVMGVAGPTAVGAQEEEDLPGGRAPLLVVGDSLCVGARDHGGEMTAQLREAQWEPSYICETGQPLSWGISQVRARDSVPRTVVVALGTNPGQYETDFGARLGSMRQALWERGARQFVWVNYSNRSGGYTAKNDALAIHTLHYGDIYVDWNARIQQNVRWFSTDGLHYTTEGRVAWAESIADASLQAHRRSTDTAVGLASTADAVWILMASGEVYIGGGAPYEGDVSALHLNGAPQAIVPTATGDGYWIMGADGGVFSFGDARFFGSTGGLRLNAPVVSMAPTMSGGGYWLLARDGGVFSFGDARFFGSTGALRLNAPVVSMDVTPSGRGYWLLARDGGVFTFGDARFLGSTGALRLDAPVVAMAGSPMGGGYWLAASDGGVFTFGGAPFKGSAVGSGASTVDLDASGDGYVLLLSDARTIDRR